MIHRASRRRPPADPSSARRGVAARRGDEPDLASDAAGCRGRWRAHGRRATRPDAGEMDTRCRSAEITRESEPSSPAMISSLMLRRRSAAGTPAAGRPGDQAGSPARGNRWRADRRQAPARSANLRMPAVGSRRVNAIRSPSGENRGVPPRGIVVGQLHQCAAGDARTKEIVAPVSQPRRRSDSILPSGEIAGSKTGVSDAIARAAVRRSRAVRQADARRGANHRRRQRRTPARSTAVAASHIGRPGTGRRGAWRRDRRRSDVRLHGFERRTHFRRRADSVRRVLRQAALDDAPEHRRHVRRQRMRRASAGSRRSARTRCAP